MQTDQIQVTTTMLLQGALFFALMDAVMIVLLTRWISFEDLVRWKWKLVAAAFVVWFAIWYSVLSIFWVDVYSFVFPLKLRPWLPIIFGLLMSLAVYCFWWVSIKFRRSPLIVFSLLAGLWGVTTHIWAINRGVITAPPMLQGSSPSAALVIAFFEYIFYFSIILLMAMLTNRLVSRVWNKH